MAKNILFLLGSRKEDGSVIDSRTKDLCDFLDLGAVTDEQGVALTSDAFDFAYVTTENCYTASGVISPTKWKRSLLNNDKLGELIAPYKAIITLDAATTTVFTRDRFNIAAKNKYSFKGIAVFPAQIVNSDDGRFIELLNRIVNAYTYTEAGAIPQPVLTKCILVESPDGVLEMLNRCLETGLCVVDVETNEIDKGKDNRVRYYQEGFKVTTLSVSPCAGVSYVMSVEHKDKSSETYIETLLAALKTLFLHKDVIKVAHNLKYDLNALSVYGITEYDGRFADTMLMAHLVNELESVSLERLTEMYLPTFHGYKIKNFNIPFNELAVYNAQDTDNTCRLFNFLEIKLREDMRKYKLYRSVSMPTFWELYYAERHGALIDTNYIESSIIECEELIAEKLQELLEFPEVENQEINFGSPKQLSELLYTANGFGIRATDPETGEVTMSTAVEVLATIDHPFIEILQQYRALNKTLGTFFKGIQEKVHEGKLHAQFKLHGTKTGRCSCSEPNLQQLTSRTGIKDERVSEMILRTKKFFVAPKGRKVVQADFSQLELRLIALFSQDPNMLQAYKDGKDLHCLTASQINNMKYEDFMDKENTDPAWYKRQRACGKGANFSLSYGCSAETYRIYLKTTYGTVISKKEAELHHRNYFKQFPSMVKWHDTYKEKGRTYGYVRTYFGRTRLLPDILSGIPKFRAKDERIGINSPVQGSGGELTFFTMSIARQVLPPAIYQFFLTVHDSMGYYVDEDKIELFAWCIKKVAAEIDKFFDYVECNREKWNIQLALDVEVGDSYGKLSKYA